MAVSDKVLEKHFDGPEKVLKFFVSKSVGNLTYLVTY